jgi:phosphatidylserine decarboxylase
MNILNKLFLSLFILFILAFVLFFPWSKAEPIQYIDRSTGELKTEKVPGEYWLNWLYYHPFGKLGLETMVKKKFLSEWYGKQMDKTSSKENIAAFIQDYQINMEDYNQEDYNSFNEFFYRKLKKGARPIDQDTLNLTSPADGKVLAYPHINNQDFIVKGYQFDLHSYLQNDSLSNVFSDASLFIIRLCPTDYHRYHFPLSGEIVLEKEIDGDYYSVSPIALRKKVELLTMNKRKYSVIRNDVFGDIIYSEVAATMVGGMIDTYDHSIIKKGDEKGYFKFGGSTIILICHTDFISIDMDLIQNTEHQLETEIKMGERIARSRIKVK